MKRLRSVPADHSAGIRPAFRGTSKPALAADAKPTQPIGAPPSQEPLTDAQVINLLERRRVAGSNRGKGTGADVKVLPPEDTHTRLLLREAVARSAPVSFAVQLQWSVNPIDAKSIPRHPIFAAYSLYAAEGRRGGRSWFFLRLGFFAEAESAKQVAHYLRSDFASAAVVPVSPHERQQVRQTGSSKAATVARSPAWTPGRSHQALERSPRLLCAASDTLTRSVAARSNRAVACLSRMTRR